MIEFEWKRKRSAKFGIVHFPVAQGIIFGPENEMQATGIYISKDKAAYWDGKNEIGESSASGVYYYSIKANGFRAIRRMVLLK